MRSSLAATRFSKTFYLFDADEEKVQIRIRLQELEIEHYDLDDVIRRLSADPAQDQLQLRRLKKRKLILKDQIQKLRARLIPDIIA